MPVYMTHELEVQNPHIEAIKYFKMQPRLTSKYLLRYLKSANCFHDFDVHDNNFPSLTFMVVANLATNQYFMNVFCCDQQPPDIWGDEDYLTVGDIRQVRNNMLSNSHLSNLVVGNTSNDLELIVRRNENWRFSAYETAYLQQHTNFEQLIVPDNLFLFDSLFWRGRFRNDQGRYKNWVILVGNTHPGIASMSVAHTNPIIASLLKYTNQSANEPTHPNRLITIKDLIYTPSFPSSTVHFPVTRYQFERLNILTQLRIHGGTDPYVDDMFNSYTGEWTAAVNLSEFLTTLRSIPQNVPLDIPTHATYLRSEF